MAGRSETEALVKDLFAARVAGDMDALGRAFAEEATFQLAGASKGSPPAGLAKGHSEIMALMERLVAAFVVSDFTILKTLIDGDTAAVHWQTTIHETAAGKSSTRELAAFIEIENGKVVSFIEFLDTSLAKKALASK